MAMGRRERDEQGSFWIPTSALPTTAAHPFYEHVNRILDGRGFDGFVEDLCRKFYPQRMGRPSLAPAVYFRLMLIGCFEGIERRLAEPARARRQDHQDEGWAYTLSSPWQKGKQRFGNTVPDRENHRLWRRCHSIATGC